MQESAKALLKIFNNLGYQAYYNGEKCRNELYNELCKGNHLSGKTTTIVTDATIEQICKTFPKHESTNNPAIINIDFGNETIQIESFHKEKYYDEEKKKFLTTPIITYVKTLDEDFERKVFTVNCVAQDKEDNHYYGVSARLDMTNKVIRTISSDKDVLFEYPIRTLQAFTLMSLTGFKISKETLKNIKSTMRYLRFMPNELVGEELRKIIVGKYASSTFKLMQKIGIFNSKCLVNGKKTKIMIPFYNCPMERFDILDKFRKSPAIELELWSVLFETPQQAETELSKFGCFSELEVHTVVWLMNNKHICEHDTNLDFRMAIYKSITPIECKNGIHYLKELILKANHIYKMLSTDEKVKERTKKLFFNLCARPYFLNQLNVNINDSQKRKLLDILIQTEHYPMSQDAMGKFITENNISEE